MSSSESTYMHAGQVVRMLDADTYDLRLDLGYFVSIDVRIRLSGVSAPEKRTSAGQAAIAFAEQHMPEGATVWVAAEQDPDRSFTRYIGRVWLPEARRWLGELLVEHGHARYGAFEG